MNRNSRQILVLLLFLCRWLSADPAAPPGLPFANDLMASERWQDLLNSRNHEVTAELCQHLFAEGRRFRNLGEFTSSMKAYVIQKAVATQIANKTCLAQAIRGIGIVAGIQGDQVAALEHYEKSLSIAREIGDKTLVAASLRSIGAHHLDLGNDEQAMDYLQQSLAISEQMNDPKSILPTLLNIGVVNVENGNFSEGLRYYTRMLSFKELEGSPDLLASTLNNIAIVYDYQGDTQQALEYYEKSMAIRQKMGDKANIANLLNNMGDSKILGDEDRALENNKKALAIAEEIGDKTLNARCLASIASAYRHKGDYAHALEFSERSLRLAEEIKNTDIYIGGLRSIALIYFAQKDYPQALEYSVKAADAGRRTHSRQDVWSSLEIQGKTLRALKQPDKAREVFQEAIATIEDWSSVIAGGEIQQLSHFAGKASVYYEMIDLLVELKQFDEALHYAERMKARALLDVLHSGKVNISHAMTPREIEEEKALEKRIVELNEKLQEADQASLKDQLQTARLDFESFRTKLYVNHPELKLTRGESAPLNVESIADQLDPDTAILEYAVTETRTFLFVLSKQSGKLTPKVYVIPILQKELSNLVNKFRRQIAERDLRIQSTAREMYQLLLAPASKDIAGKPTLMLVPDDILWEMAFQALQAESGRYVIQDHAIHYTPSLTVYYEMRRLHKEGTQGPTLLAFGNPDIGKENSDRLSAVYRDQKLAPLPEAEKEVTTLKFLYGEKQSKVFTGLKAREDYLKEEASHFQILHFATHGILNDTTPLYSQILLTRGDGAVKEDGLLEAWEIMNLDLKADLVVLSACETALGRVRRGEGMIGLTWAFFIAGAPTTVVSQWKVHSASTTELMLDFHRQMRSTKRSISKAEALRQAALHLMQTEGYHHPFYWAPFIVVGL